MKKWVVIISLALFPALLAAQGQSERYDFFVRGISVEDAIIKLIRETSINVAYDSRIEMSSTVFINVKDATVDQILKDILKNTGLDYLILSTGTYVITRTASTEAPKVDFKGYIRDARTGEPLPNATVYIADASGSAIANENGYFTFSSLLSGSYEIVASYVGYKAKRTEIQISQEESPVRIIELQPESYLIEPLLITGDSYQYTSRTDTDEYSFNSSEISLSPYSNTIRSLNAFSGINFNWAQDEISIQGSSSRDHLLTLDGVPLYNNDVAGGTFGIFSPYAIDRIEVSKAAFGAKKGSALSGVINYSHDLVPQNAKTLKVQADPYSFNTRLSGELFRSEKLSGMIAFRGSLWDQFREPQLNRTLNDWNRLDPLLQNFIMGSDGDLASYSSVAENNNFRFTDLHFASEYRHNPYQKTSVSGYFGYSNSSVDLLSARQQLISGQPDFVFADDNTAQSNEMIQISHDAVLSSRTDAAFQLYYSAADFRNRYNMVSHNTGNAAPVSEDEVYRQLKALSDLDNESMNMNRIREWGAIAGISYYFGNSLKLNAGIEPKFIDYRFQLSDLFYFPTVTQNNTLLLGTYSEFENLSSRFGYKIGLRNTFHGDHGKVYLEPRAEIYINSSEVARFQNKWVFSAGIYRQFINQFNLSSPGPNALSPSYKLWEPNDATTSVPRSFNFTANWSVFFNEKISFKVESYYKIRDNSWALNYNSILSPLNTSLELSDQQFYFEQVNSQNFGGSLSLMVTDPESSLFFKLVQESNFALQQFGQRFDNQVQNSPFSEPYTLSALFRVPVFSKTDISFSGQWTPIRYWAYNNAYYNFIEIHDNRLFSDLDLSSPGDDRLSYYLRLDLAVNQQINIKDVIMGVRLDLINILNRQNEVYRFLNPVQDNSASGISYQTNHRLLPGFTPLLSVQFDL
ncbi:carboxypeptidase-like regulatory domain-containing protein [Balneola sp. MJW-20]|uniref:carboxypeptidase-like regulatory domain-containing protein n=1 Tax=Gracilimonas aurantiaca TaxID=3234185 RepID=UPI00346678F0